MGLSNAEQQQRRLDARAPVAYVPPPPLPAPEKPWTPVDITECSSANSLLKKARAAGWDARAFVARGPYIGADGQPLDTADGVALLFFWGPRPEAWAHWYRRADKWALEGAWLLGPITRLGGNDIGHWLAGTEPAKKKEKAA